jgi:hypothetical protein
MRALIIAVVALALLFAAAVVLFSVSLRARRRRVLRAAPSLNGLEPILPSLTLRHELTRFADGIDWPAPVFGRGQVAVVCTDEGIEAARLTIRHREIEDAAIASGRLRLRWRRGGEDLESFFAGDVVDLERLRREIHLRQAHDPKKLMALAQP